MPPPVTVVEPMYVQPVVVSPPVVMAPPPVVQVPTVQTALPMPQGILWQGVISRDDDIAPKAVLTVDGIVVKINDADRHPLDVDIELNGHDFDDLPLGSRVDVYGQSGQLYHLDILGIDGESETLQFAIGQ